ncbi:calmodulin-binding transcription activator 3-like isoform X1 [Typha latifolia]|uniref:calmodulin-binding transcription activator 3-like isoform X1 n=2 Tax=Typha latifolia TaxID=4733 RepID=UPI003C2D1F76
MAETRRCAPIPQLDIALILHEAKERWLRPMEICKILHNYQRFNLTPDPPYKPSGGSLFLFDRKTLRYFRKDGHNWRKKRDGKTVQEAHEKLKCGSVDVLHCYYAHGEDNENFQRRSYWMLDGQLEHIVLVHYRDVNEGGRSNSTYSNSSTFSSLASFASSPSATDWSGQTPSAQFGDADSEEEFDIGTLADTISCSQLLDASFPGNDTEKENVAGSSNTSYHMYSEGFPDSAFSSRSFDLSFANQVPWHNLTSNMEKQNTYEASQGSFHVYNSAERPELLSTRMEDVKVKEQYVSFEQTNFSGDMPRRVIDHHANLKCVLDYNYNVVPSDHSPMFAVDDKRQCQVEAGISGQVNSLEDKDMFNESVHNNWVMNEHLGKPQFKNKSGLDVNLNATEQPLEYETEASYVLKESLETEVHNDEVGFKKLDSFGRWMNKEIGKDCSESMIMSDYCNYWNTFDTQTDDKEVTNLSSHMQLEADSLGPSISQEQLFSIIDFSPDWSYSNIETKVLISGTFLGSVDPRSIKWCCMFGVHEVSAELLTTSVLRCQAPPHLSGRVPFYVTCSNRLACSEIREFDYRENLYAISLLPKGESDDEFHLQVRFARLLSLGVNRKRLVCSVENCDKCNITEKLYPLLNDDKTGWNEMDEDSKAFNGLHSSSRDKMIQNLLKCKLYEWLVWKAHDEGRGPNVLDEEGQGAIHLAAALGYEWAMGAIVAAGVNPSFRDACGRTGLHWAAYYGREETVSELVRLGAAPGAVEDPTSNFPQGKTAADLASYRGHKGIAGYLAEADLTSHLSSLVLKDSSIDGLSTNLAVEKAIEIAQEQNIVYLGGDKRDQLSLRGSLDALRNSAQAAARIQAAFRVQSFRQKQLTVSKDEDTGILDGIAVLSALSVKSQKIRHFNESLHTAAVKIQQNYRGWKGRKEFLRICDRIVKIQAHVRGHQVRKQYRKVIWSVSIVEKAILRWRRKGAGLRGFRAEKINSTVEKDVEKNDEYDFLRLGRKQKEVGVQKALARVQSMARHREARDQYMRLVASSHRLKQGDGSSFFSISKLRR